MNQIDLSKLNSAKDLIEKSLSKLNKLIELTSKANEEGWSDLLTDVRDPLLDAKLKLDGGVS